VRAYRTVVGEKLSQVGLDYGANDIGGSLMEEQIQKKAGSGTRQYVGRDDMIHAIRDAGRMPVERDEMYNVVERFDADGDSETATADD